MGLLEQVSVSVQTNTEFSSHRKESKLRRAVR